MMILVTGSSGTVGTELLKELAKTGQSVRAGYRSRPPSVPGVQPARVDLVTGEGLDTALKGADAVFLLTADTKDQTAAELRAVEAAKRAGVKRLVKLSVLGAETEGYSYARLHRPVERAIEASDIPYTILRPDSFMQNFVNHYGETIRKASAFYLPHSDTPESHVDARDVARVAAIALTRSGHEGKAYDLVGPEALTYVQAAAKISAAVGRTVSYVGLSDADFRKAMAGAGAPEDAIDRLVDLFRFIRDGRMPRASSAINDVTGREPIAFDEFARDYAASWKP